MRGYARRGMIESSPAQLVVERGYHLMNATEFIYHHTHENENETRQQMERERRCRQYRRM